MSKGTGKVERRIAELFRKSGPYIGISSKPGLDRTWTAAELAAVVFRTKRPTRSQQLSVKRAVRSTIRRMHAISSAASALKDQAYKETVAQQFGGREPRLWSLRWEDDFLNAVRSHPKAMAAARIEAKIKTVEHMLHWVETVRADGVVVFHDYARPVRIWAVTIVRSGVVWVEAEIEEITRDRVSVRYRGVRCPLARGKVAMFGAWWRGVCFVSSQDGLAARVFWQQWQEQFGHLEPLRMPFDQARQMLGVPEKYTREDVIKAFRKLALTNHPDHGGDAEMFRKLVEARDLLLNMIGSKAEPESMKAPDFEQPGAKIVYHRWRARGASRITGNGSRMIA